jgi:hypothetical protein
LYLIQFLPVKLKFTLVFKPTACVILLRKAADETIAKSFKSFRRKKRNVSIITDKKLTKKFVGLVSNGLGFDVVFGW